MTTISEAVEKYLQNIARARSPRTARTYRNGLNAFKLTLLDSGLNPDTFDVANFDEGSITVFIENLGESSPATESLYLTAARNFYQFLAAERLADPNLPRLQELIHHRGRKQAQRIPQFPRDEIEKLIEYAESLVEKSVTDIGIKAKSEDGEIDERNRARLRNLRDRAFILFLADTGLRVSEACSLTLGDVDFLEGRLTIIGKGNKQAVVRISERALAALKDYLTARKGTGVNISGRKSKSLPLFVRHDRGTGDGLNRIAASTAWDLVKARAREAVGEAAEQIHPHSFRHYFVTVILLATNNLEKARRLARHSSTTITQRYAQVDPELDEDYHNIFNQKLTNSRKKN
jgi:integrase/recombinase XerC